MAAGSIDELCPLSGRPPMIPAAYSLVYHVCMTRRNISLPDDLDQAARNQGLNVSALAQQAIVDALDRQSRMAGLDAWLDELDAEHGPPSAEAIAEADAWAASATPGAGKPGSLTGTPDREGIGRRSRTGVSKAAKSGVIQSTRVTPRTTKSASKSTLSKAGGRIRKAAS